MAPAAFVDDTGGTCKRVAGIWMNMLVLVSNGGGEVLASPGVRRLGEDALGHAGLHHLSGLEHHSVGAGLAGFAEAVGPHPRRHAVLLRQMLDRPQEPLGDLR